LCIRLEESSRPRRRKNISFDEKQARALLHIWKIRSISVQVSIASSDPLPVMIDDRPDEVPVMLFKGTARVIETGAALRLEADGFTIWVDLRSVSFGEDRAMPTRAVDLTSAEDTVLLTLTSGDRVFLAGERPPEGKPS
jgi:hypothetical protein